MTVLEILGLLNLLAVVILGVINIMSSNKKKYPAPHTQNRLISDYKSTEVKP